MPSVLIPQGGGGSTKMLGSILPAVGSLFGPIGGAIGTAAGAVVGGSAQNQEAKAGKIAQGAAQAGQDSAMKRRMQEIDDDPDIAIARANKALEMAPEDVRKEYEPALREAVDLSQKRTGAGGMTRPY